MKIAIQDIRDVPTVVTFGEDAGQLNTLLQKGVRDYVAKEQIGVSVSYYRTGMDVVLEGEFWASMEGTCSRCLAEYPFRVAKGFSMIMVPATELGPGREGASSGELRAEDLALGYYQDDEIDLSPLVLEQLILALPTRPLCDTECRGLCQQCGASLNPGDCGCEVISGDPRLAVLRKLKVGG